MVLHDSLAAAGVEGLAGLAPDEGALVRGSRVGGGRCCAVTSRCALPATHPLPLMPPLPSKQVSYYLALEASQFVGSSVSAFSSLITMERRRADAWASWYNGGAMPLERFLPLLP